jgi:hypothetical protein
LIDFGLAKKESSTNPIVDKNGKPIDDDPKENVIDPKTGKKKTA